MLQAQKSPCFLVLYLPVRIFPFLFAEVYSRLERKGKKSKVFLVAEVYSPLERKGKNSIVLSIFCSCGSLFPLGKKRKNMCKRKRKGKNSIVLSIFCSCASLFLLGKKRKKIQSIFSCTSLFSLGKKRKKYHSFKYFL